MPITTMNRGIRLVPAGGGPPSLDFSKPKDSQYIPLVAITAADPIIETLSPSIGRATLPMPFPRVKWWEWHD